MAEERRKTDASPTPAGSTASAGAEGSTAEGMATQALDNAQDSLDDVRRQVDAKPMNLPDLGASDDEQGDALSGIDMLGDVELHVTVELGRTHMLVEDVLRLSEGSIVELDKLAGDPVDVFVNGRLVARGEVLVLNDSFCIRISEIVSDLEEQVQEAAAQVAQPA